MYYLILYILSYKFRLSWHLKYFLRKWGVAVSLMSLALIGNNIFTQTWLCKKAPSCHYEWSSIAFSSTSSINFTVELPAQCLIRNNLSNYAIEFSLEPNQYKFKQTIDKLNVKLNPIHLKKYIEKEKNQKSSFWKIWLMEMVTFIII